MISCREIVHLPSLNRLRLVAGEAGLDRVVRWVHFIDLPDVIPWVQGGELLIITGIALQGDAAKLKEVVRGSIRKKLAGLIVNVGRYIEAVPPDVVALADKAGFPIFELPWEVKLIDVTQEICSHIIMKQTEERSLNDFLEQLLFRPLADSEVLIERAAFYGYDLTKPHQVAIIRPHQLREFLQTQREKDEKALVALKVRFERIVREALERRGRKMISMLWLDDMHLLMPHPEKDTQSRQNVALLAEIIERLAAEIPGLFVSAALGGTFECLQAARNSYLQANKALRFSERKKVSPPICLYEQLGIYKLLFEVEADKLAAYHQEVIEPLNEYDKKHHMAMAECLTVYFEENCNAAKTAKRLFLHRNTLDYRLKKIEEITERSLNDPYDRLTLQLGTLIARQLDGDAVSPQVSD
jgi:PucR family transcriptional regulator, purine catabolism regulatory protein